MSVILRFGGMPCFFRSRVSGRLAALVLRRVWTISSSGSIALTFAAVFTGMSPNLSTDVTPPRYKRHRFPAEIIAHAVWLYFRFRLSLRHIEHLLAERGIEVSFQTAAE